MIRIRVQYDARNRTFKLVDQEFRTILEGDAIYDLGIPLTLEESDEEDDFTVVNNIPIAHA
ncbi:MAG: hypothetical protein DMG12_07130 [Acidobacteria bacterium]|nr:MAG: hypothetical protein DMG12_07130 [Acidobacteriota bacterium]